MRNRILLILLVLAGIAGIVAVVWFILRPVLPKFSPQPPASTQQPSERPFNPTPNIPQAPTSSGAVDANSPAERERQAQEALKRTAIDLATRLNTYSNANNYEALRQAQSIVDKEYAKQIEGLRENLKREHPSFGPSYGITTNALSAVINSPPPIFTATQASVSVHAQRIVEKQGKPDEVSQVRIDLNFKKDGTTWILTGQSIQNTQ